MATCRDVFRITDQLRQRGMYMRDGNQGYLVVHTPRRDCQSTVDWVQVHSWKRLRLVAWRACSTPVFEDGVRLRVLMPV